MISTPDLLVGVARLTALISIEKGTMTLTQGSLWPYLPTFERLALALAVGLMIGLERERRGKEAGLRTFSFASLLGALGGLLGTSYALLALALLGVLTVMLNVGELKTTGRTELTTSAALLVTGFAGVLCGLGHTLTPTAVAVVTSALLAWKERLAGFSIGLTEAELRSAILMGILAFVIYPALPSGTVDPWHVLDLRLAWTTVILIAGIGFTNYVLWKLYGARGIELTGFLGGLVNSSVTAAELANRHLESLGQLSNVAYRGIMLATAAMVLRNAVLLAILAPKVLFATALPLVAMFAASLGLAYIRWQDLAQSNASDAPTLRLESPFSLRSALKFGLLFLALQVAGTIAQTFLGQFGFYGVSLIGGLLSSASAVASAGTLASHAALPVLVAGIGALIATFASVLINLLLVVRVAPMSKLVWRLTWALGVTGALGVVGVWLQSVVMNRFFVG